jgi:hypothetical protein
MKPDYNAFINHGLQMAQLIAAGCVQTLMQQANPQTEQKVMKNRIGKSLLFLAVGGLMSVGAAVAQNDPGAGQYDPGHPRVNQVDQREVNQQERIGQGVKSGSLTAGEAEHLEKNEARIQQQKQADMAAHGGHLTKSEQNQLNREQNAQSRQIYKDKHNNKVR